MPTERRIHKIARALHSRQMDFLLALDGVHDPHNISAILRTADATGISEVFWQADREDPDPPNPEVSMGSERWVRMVAVPDLRAHLLPFKERGFSVAATHLGRQSVDFRQVDWTRPWIVVLGNEHRGCSESILEITDANITLPMVGFVQSLNVSVAAAVLLYEVQRQREAAGFYRRPQPAEVVETLYKRWILDTEGITLAEVLSMPVGPPPEDPTPHQDGRPRGRGRQSRTPRPGRLPPQTGG